MRFRGIESPCKDCEKRHPACHDKCEDFKKFRQKHEKALHEWKEEKTLDGVISNLNYESTKKWGKKEIPEPLKHGRKPRR